MKKIFNATLVLAVVAGAVQADIELNGVLGGADGYSNNENVTWFNGHRTAESIYGSFDNQFANTNISYGVSTLAGESTGVEYFFLHVEAPLYAKNMIWEDRVWADMFVNTDPNAGLVEADVASYRVHHETHHSPFDMKLDFRGATHSEKMIFLDSNGDSIFKADLAGDADNKFGLMGYMSSVDYLLDNGLATESLSLARDRTMSFEFQFALDGVMNEQILEYARNGIEFHMSPDRGLEINVVPLPSAAIAGLGMLAGLGAYRRIRR